MGWIWTENLEKKTFHEPFLKKFEKNLKLEETKLIQSPETMIEDEEDD